MDQIEIARRRLAAQQIAPPAAGGPAELVARLGAVQAQDYLGALWAVGARVPGAADGDVTAALAEGRIVRTWPMRGTIHLVAPGDVRWMLALLTPRVVQASQGRMRQLGIDAAAVAASERAIVAGLEGGRQLTRGAAFALLEAAGVATGSQRGYHILLRLAQAGLICFGPHAGKQPTFVLLDEWAPAAAPLARDEALAALALRYFASRGPATIHDFCWWSGLTVADARAGLGAVAGALASATHDGQAYYFDEAATAAGGVAGGLALLPPFDELLIAYRDRGAALDPAHSALVVPGANGIFNPIVVWGGRVVGTWRRVLRARRVELSFSPFERWPGGLSEALPEAAARYGRFLGLPAVVEAGAA